MKKDAYLGLKEAAKYLGVSRNKMYQLARDGSVPFYLSSLDRRRKLFRPGDLDALKKVKRAAT